VILGTATAPLTGATYGGETMTELASSPLIHDDAEDSVVHVFFLGEGIPTGTQNFTISGSGVGSALVYVYIVTAADDTSVNAEDTHQAVEADPSGTIALGGVDSYVTEGWASGENFSFNVSALTNWTFDNGDQASSMSSGAMSYDIVGSSDVTYGYNEGSSPANTQNIYCVALREGVASAGDPFKIPPEPQPPGFFDRFKPRLPGWFSFVGGAQMEESQTPADPMPQTFIKPRMRVYGDQSKFFSQYWMDILEASEVDMTSYLFPNIPDYEDAEYRKSREMHRQPMRNIDYLWWGLLFPPLTPDYLGYRVTVPMPDFEEIIEMPDFEEVAEMPEFENFIVVE
jgi:hypothetical protein